MKKIILDKESNKILLANGKGLEGGLFEITFGVPKDVTNDVLKAVFCWFENQITDSFEPKVSLKGSNYELVLRKKS